MESQNVDFYEAGSGSEGLMMHNKVQPDLVVLDLGLPDIDGLDILPLLKAPHVDGRPVPKVIVLTVRKENESKDKAKLLGADAYITKPFLVDELMEAIEATIHGKTYINT